MVIFRNYKYRLGIRKSGITTWRCVGYDSYKCKGRIRTMNNDLFVVHDEHNHAPLQGKSPSILTSIVVNIKAKLQAKR